MEAITSKTVRRQAERPWCDVASPVFNAETKTFDYSELLADIPVNHPWYRDDRRFIIPSGIPVAVNEDGGDVRSVFPCKRTRLASAVTDTDTDYPVENVKPFKIGDEITLSGGTPQAITAIDYSTKTLTVGVTIGVAGAIDAELWTPDKATAIGFTLEFLDLTETTNDIVISMLVDGFVFGQVVHNSIFEITAQLQADLKSAGIKFNPSLWTPPSLV